MQSINTNNSTKLQICKIGEPLIVLDQINSTNSYAIDQIQSNLAAHGTAYLAKEQLQGKGQRGKTWKSTYGENILLSVVLNTQQLSITHQFLLSAAMALACNDFFSAYTNGDTSIKWPNDIYWNDRKAAGILIENVLRGQNWQWAIVGIGMNINQTVFPPFNKQAVSLKQITGKTYVIEELCKELCAKMQERFEQLVGKNVLDLLYEYNNLLYKKNELVKLKRNTSVFSCMPVEVNKNGQLIIDNGSITEAINWGEVEWLN